MEGLVQFDVFGKAEMRQNDTISSIVQQSQLQDVSQRILDGSRPTSNEGGQPRRQGSLQGSLTSFFVRWRSRVEAKAIKLDPGLGN